MRALRSALVVALVLATGAEAFAQDGFISGRIRRWQPDLSGDVTASGDSLPGTGLGLTSTFGLDDKTDVNELLVEVKIPILGRVSFSKWDSKYDGSETLSQTINFGNQSFTLGTNIDTEFEYSSTCIMFHFGLGTPKMMGTGVNAGVSLGVDLVEASFSISGAGISESAEVKGGVPVFGAYTRGQLVSFLYLEVEVRGLIIPGILTGGLDGQFYQGSVSVDARFSKFYVGLGWKLFQFKIDDDSGTGVGDVTADFKMQGLFFELGFSL